MGGNALGSKGAKMICESLCGANRIKELDLSENGIDDNAAASIGKLVFECKLVKLHLKGNLLSSEGISTLFDVLRTKNRSLRVLDISQN